MKKLIIYYYDILSITRHLKEMERKRKTESVVITNDKYYINVYQFNMKREFN
jgi:hypothetical protein